MIILQFVFQITLISSDCSRPLKHIFSIVKSQQLTCRAQFHWKYKNDVWIYAFYSKSIHVPACRHSLECCYGWKTNTSTISLVSMKCTQVLSCTNFAVSQAGKWLGSLTGLWSKAFGSQTCKATKWQVTQRYLIN